MSKKGRFTQLKAGRKRAYLKAQPVKYNPDVRRLLTTHPDHLRQSKPLVEKVLDKDGNVIEKHPYVAPQRDDNPLYKMLLREDDRRTLYLCIQGGGTVYFVEINHILERVRQSVNYGSGQSAKETLFVFGEEAIRWSVSKFIK